MLQADGIRNYADPVVVRNMLDELRSLVNRPLRFMEVCGTHTMAIFESGLRPRLSGCGIELLSGPGCPVCVTSQEDIDFALHIAADPEVVFCTFGDMLRVPGTSTTLAELKGQGADVRVVYSPLDALEQAGKHPGRRVVFLAIGFETTVPAIASTVKLAHQQGQDNFYIFPSHKTIPGPMVALATHPELSLDGFMCPGHVSVVLGTGAYQPVVDASSKPCVVTGFEPVDIMAGVLGLARQAVEERACVENAYPRVVKPEGNPAARAVIDEVFMPADASWRGLGMLPMSGLDLQEKYKQFDIRPHYGGFVPPGPNKRLAACRCGDVLVGLINPPQCVCFGTSCTPEQPLGPCMVSHEGSCRAYYRNQGLEARDG